MEATWSGISNINNYQIEGVKDTELDLEDFKLFFFTPDAPKGNKNISKYRVYLDPLGWGRINDLGLIQGG